VNERVLSLVLTVLLVVSSISTLGVGLVGGSSAGNTAGNATTFQVTQGGECYDVAPLGDGSQSVEDFYDYRSNETHPNQSDYENWTYSSWGTTHLQENQGSKLFVYNGSDGYNLVVLHDKFATDGTNGSNGSVATFTMSGMADVSWAVRDDTYGNDTQDDDWDTDGSVHQIDWMWGSNRTDGGAARDVQGESITIAPDFNENASAWGEWPYSGDDNNRTESWSLIDGDESEQSLDMGRNVTVETGSCTDTTGPDADLTANPNVAGNDETVTLDASESTDDDSGIDQYRWDFDGDGEVEYTTTDEATVEHTYESPGDYTASVTVVDGKDNEGTATANVTVVDRSATNITFLNATAVEIEGSYDTVRLDVGFYTETGYANQKPGATNVSGTTVITVDDYGVNGSVINTVELFEDGMGDTVEERDHPRLDHYAETIEPHPVTVSVADVTETSEDTYEVTYRYENPNEESLEMRDSTLSGNVAGDAPEVVEPGTHTFTATWTPESDDERATWTLDRSNFGQSEVSASTESAGELGDDEKKTDESPTARLSSDGTGPLSQPFVFDASASTDDHRIDWYRWDFDSDGEAEWKGEDGLTSMFPHKHVDGPGTYKATVTVIDSSGQTDTATVEYTVEKVPPTATIEASSDTVEVGEEVTFTATEFSEDPDFLRHVCWEVGDEPGPDGHSWTTSFEESGQKTIELVLRDHAGHENVVERTITVTDGGNDDDDGNDGDDGDDGDRNDENGYEDDPNEEIKNDSLPLVDDDDTLTVPLNGENVEMGNVALVQAADANGTLDVSQTTPASVDAPAVSDDGFEALSYVTVADAERLTFTVADDRLDAADVTADAVTLFRYEDGAWTAIETEQVTETDAVTQFAANVSDATYAVGIDRPSIGVTDLSVESQRVDADDTVSVLATVENDGRAEGTHEVRLSVGGDVVATETVSVEAGSTTDVSLSHQFEESGVYDVSVEGEDAEVVVEEVESQSETSDESGAVETTDSTNDSGGVPGFGVSVSLVALLGAALLALRRG
jgi:PGF-CTERM protein